MARLSSLSELAARFRIGGITVARLPICKIRPVEANESSGLVNWNK